MADVETPPVEAVTEAMPTGDLNDTEQVINGTTGKIPAHQKA